MIEASAPVRICDNGGWTDTWFGGPGRVVNIAVNPGVRVSVEEGGGPHPVTLAIDASGDRYGVTLGGSRQPRHPLVEAAVDAWPPPPDRDVEIRVHGGVPPGCGTGTSAAVAVAMVAALATARNEQLSRRHIAYAAHRLEVDILGTESGIQDQLSAAFGGINYIEVEPYPEATVQRLPAWPELDTGLSLVYLGRAHDSSGLHRQVIEEVKSRDPVVFGRLRQAAVAGRDAVLAQDLAAFGRSMIANTEAQECLHPALVGADARQVIGLAAAQQAIGWKVNGAGGDGGSLTLLSASRPHREELERQVVALDPRYQILPIQVSGDGVRVQGAISSA